MSRGRNFRDWLIERLQGTQHVRVRLNDRELDDTAKMLGVQPDVLAEARIEHRMRCAREGIQPPLGGKRAETRARHIQLRCEMPPSIWTIWKDHCADSSVHPSALLRSLVQEYLLNQREPENLLGYWVWEGRHVPIPKTIKSKKKTAYPYEERCLVTRGAARALERRAQQKGCTRAALLRGLVLDTLERKHPHVVRLVDARTMYDDEERYLGNK